MADDGSFLDSPGSGDGDGRDPEHRARLSERVITSPIVMAAFAIAVILVAIGLVALVLMMALLWFFFPEKANAFVLLVGAPLVALVIAHSPAAFQVSVRLLNGKPTTVINKK